MKTKLEIEGDTVNVKKKAPTFIIDDGRGRKIPGRAVRVGDTTHIHVYGEKGRSETGGRGSLTAAERRRKLEQELARRRAESVRAIKEEEILKHEIQKMKKERQKLREELQEKLKVIDAEEEALKRHKLQVLLRGSEKFREEFTGGLKLFHPTDPFKVVNTVEYLKKVKKNKKKFDEMVAKARKAGEAWEDGSLLRRYEPTLKKIIADYPKHARKLTYEGLYREIGKPFEKFCEITRLKRIGFVLDPTEFIRLPFIREYRADIRKMRHLDLVKSIEMLEGHKRSLEKNRQTIKDLDYDMAAFHEQQRRRAA